jgi:hypothetical protein
VGDRNFLREARRILDEHAPIIPEAAHLQALDAQLQAINRNVISLGEIVAAVLDDNGKPAMQVPAATLEKVRLARVMPLVQRQPDGSVIVRIMPLGAPLSKPSPSVN